MDKSNKFTPNKSEACKLADDYWKDLSDYREKFLDNLKTTIVANAKVGKYEITQKVLKDEKEYIKGKLEDVGYTISFSEDKDDEKYDFIKISFK
ncbi:hypothetical protein KD33_16745 [Clostridium sp. NCR]|nr:hypothetical protein KD33_16745 [Clostridium sp. NCR]